MFMITDKKTLQSVGGGLDIIDWDSDGGGAGGSEIDWGGRSWAATPGSIPHDNLTYTGEAGNPNDLTQFTRDALACAAAVTATRREPTYTNAGMAAVACLDLLNNSSVQSILVWSLDHAIYPMAGHLD